MRSQDDVLVDYWTALVTAVQIATRTSDSHEGRDLGFFMASHVRLPRVGDDRAPWSFRGWLLPMVIDLLKVDHFPGRWGYWMHVRCTGELPPGPIPHVDFSGGGDAGRKNVRKCVEILAYESGSCVYNFLRWLAWSLAVTADPPEMTEEINEKLYRTFSIDHWLKDPADYLGWIMCEYKGRGYDPTGFFPTPQAVVNAMVDMLWSDLDPEDVWKSCLDPCVGSGRMLLAASNHTLNLAGQDISHRCVLATLINGAVYVPWLSFPLRRLENLTEGDTLAPVELVTEENGQGILFV